MSGPTAVRPKFGVLYFSYAYFSFERVVARDGHVSINLGDYMQTIAVRNFYRKLGIPDADVIEVDRDTMARYKGEPVIVVMNACFYKEAFPIPRNIVPVFIGFQAHEDVILENQDYFRENAPIGCRDTATAELFAKHGIEAFVTGCMTLSFDKRPHEPSRKKIVVAYGNGVGSFPGAALQTMPAGYLEHVEFVSQRHFVHRCPLEWEGMRHAEVLAQRLFDYYRAEATLVVTPLHHAATPCMSSEIPVIICRNDHNSRFSYLKQLIDVHVARDFSGIDWHVGAIDMTEYRRNLIATASAAVRTAIEAYCGKPRSIVDLAVADPADLASITREIASAARAGDNRKVVSNYEALAVGDRVQVDGATKIIVAKAYVATKRPHLAAAICRTMLETAPSSAVAHANLLIALMSIGKHEDSLEAALVAETHCVAVPGVLLYAARAANAAGRVDDAIRMLERAILVEPSNFPCRLLLGALYGQRRGDWLASVGHAEIAVELKSGDPDANRILGEGLLRCGEYGRGFDHYRLRLNSERLFKQHRRPFAHPTWNGQPIDGKLLLLPETEQGVGFELLTSTLIPDLEGGGLKVVFEATPKLIPLLSKLYPSADFVAFSEGGDARLSSGNISHQTYFSEACAVLRRSVRDFVGAKHPGMTLRSWQSGEHGSSLTRPLRIGISWSTTNPVYGRDRTIPLREWARLVKGLPFDVQLVNLQYGTVADQIERFTRETGIAVEHIPEADYFENISAFLDDCRSVDLVVSIDNSTVFFAALLGKPVCMLLPSIAHWIWAAGDHRSLWLPSVEIFRKPAAADWGEVFSAIRSHIALSAR